MQKKALKIFPKYTLVIRTIADKTEYIIAGTRLACFVDHYIKMLVPF